MDDLVELLVTVPTYRQFKRVAAALDIPLAMETDNRFINPEVWQFILRSIRELGGGNPMTIRDLASIIYSMSHVLVFKSMSHIKNMRSLVCTSNAGGDELSQLPDDELMTRAIKYLSNADELRWAQLEDNKYCYLVVVTLPIHLRNGH